MSTRPLRELLDALAFLFTLTFTVGVPLALLYVWSSR